MHAARACAALSSLMQCERKDWAECSPTQLIRWHGTRYRALEARRCTLSGRQPVRLSRQRARCRLRKPSSAGAAARCHGARRAQVGLRFASRGAGPCHQATSRRPGSRQPTRASNRPRLAILPATLACEPSTIERAKRHFAAAQRVKNAQGGRAGSVSDTGAGAVCSACCLVPLGAPTRPC